MRRLLVLVIGMISVIWLATPATAAPATLHVTPHTVPAGGTVRVSGTCEPHSVGYAISSAFVHDASHDFAGVGAVSFSTNAAGAFSVSAQVSSGTAAGNYPVGARCGGGNLGISVTLTVTASGSAAAAGSAPTAVPAGTGGLAATDRTPQPLLFGGVGLLLLLAGGALLLVRRGRRPVD